jgi:hypothetical protein
MCPEYGRPLPGYDKGPPTVMADGPLCRPGHAEELQHRPERCVELACDTGCHKQVEGLAVTRSVFAENTADQEVNRASGFNQPCPRGIGVRATGGGGCFKAHSQFGHVPEHA